MPPWKKNQKGKKGKKKNHEARGRQGSGEDRGWGGWDQVFRGGRRELKIVINHEEKGRRKGGIQQKVGPSVGERRGKERCKARGGKGVWKKKESLGTEKWKREVPGKRRNCRGKHIKVRIFVWEKQENHWRNERVEGRAAGARGKKKNLGGGTARERMGREKACAVEGGGGGRGPREALAAVSWGTHRGGEGSPICRTRLPQKIGQRTLWGRQAYDEGGDRAKRDRPAHWGGFRKEGVSRGGGGEKEDTFGGFFGGVKGEAFFSSLS